MSETLPYDKQKDLERRAELGKAGQLWSIEVIFKRDEMQQTGKHTLTNQTAAELMNFRAQIFTHGMLLPLDPGHWTIIFPCDLISIDVWRQKKLF